MAANSQKNNRAAHLAKHKFKPGQSGNPSGRPKLRPITEEYARIINLPLPEELRRQLKLQKGATWGSAIAMGTVRAAVKGNHGASKELREALEGKATQRVELTAEGGGPIKISLEATVEKIKAFYGLSTGDDPATETPHRAVPVSGQVDRGQAPQEDREQK